MSQGFTSTPYFLKCSKCGKMHLYEHITFHSERLDEVDCPTCGAKLDLRNVVLIGEEFNSFERH